MKIDTRLCPFPLILQRLRHAKGLSQRQLAAQLNHSHSVIYNWQSGGNLPTLLDIVKLCTILSTTPNVLCGWELDKQKKVTDERAFRLTRNAVGPIIDHWRKAMAYELVEKKQRAASGQERVSISSTGRLFLLSSAVIQKYLADAEYVQIYIDNDPNDNEVKIALRPMKRGEENTYSIVKPRRSKSGYVTAKSTLTRIGYKHNLTYARDAKWVERSINGRKTQVLEFGVERKYCKQ